MGTRVTQRVDVGDLADLADLAEAPPRAAIAFATDDGPTCLPVVMRRQADGILVGADPGALPSGGLPERAVLLVDDGRFWFELRAVVWRGRLEPASAPPEGAAGEPGDGGLVWLRLVPRRVAAWDYGRLREVPG